MAKELINLLLVEDDPAYQRIVSIVLAKSSHWVDYNIETANSITQAIECLERQKFNVILLDLGLPDSSGTDGIEKIHGLCSGTAIVVLTGQMNEEVGLEAINKGADDYFIKDETLKGILARTIRYAIERKKITEELRAAQEKLVETARKAGMAEVATNVLHNVGNVLNSINVLTTLLTEKVSKSRLATLAKVAGIINDHIGDLGTFLTEDPQGKHVPVYLTEVSKFLIDEQADTVDRLQALAKNVQHIKDIVNMQQSYARVSGVKVPTSLAELLEDAIQINSAGFESRGVRLRREFDELPMVEIDRQKVLHILVDLVSNAKHALSESDKEQEIMTIRLCKQGEDRFRIEVVDNGVGIPEENLTKIFSHGFTTKKHGHGFGLHSGALTANEMGGSLSVSSDGVGKGAIFTLELPFEPVKVTQ